MTHRYKFAISEVTTIQNTFEEDVVLYHRSGATGIGVWGFKLETVGAARAAELLRQHDMGAANCIPALNSVLPYVLSPEPADPEKRVEAFLPNLEEMAKLNPESIVVITGPAGDRDPEAARDLCIQGFRRIAQVAGDLGVDIGFEPLHRSQQQVFSPICNLRDAMDLVRAVEHPRFKLLFDTWHLWDTEHVYDDIRQYIDYIAGVHVADWREPTRTWADRAFPGEGIIPILDLVRALDEAGFRGHYDIELFSDDGRYGTDHPDSLWKLPAETIVERATRLFRALNEA
jgi:sugar phosphate isomerase/epimerase